MELPAPLLVCEVPPRFGIVKTPVTPPVTPPLPAAPCVTVITRPATVNVAVRAPPVLAATFNVIVPAPEPDVALDAETHDGSSEAAQAQSDVVEMFTVKFAPPAASGNAAGVM